MPRDSAVEQNLSAFADVVIADLHDRAFGPAILEIRLHAEESERQQDDREDDLDDALVALDEIEHEWLTDTNIDTKKGEPQVRLFVKRGDLGGHLFSVFGGVDGTRTRDPRCDRPVF